MKTNVAQKEIRPQFKPVDEPAQRQSKSVPFAIIHLLALSVFFFPFSWKLVGMAFALYVVRMFAITAGYHRYFSHRTYKMSRVPQFLMAFLGGTSAQKGALWWAANHRHHHRYSDEPEDIHSPLQSGFWHSHVGWILSVDNDRTRWELIKDLSRYPELVWLNKHQLVPPVAMGIGCFIWGGWAAVAWFFLSMVVCWHSTFTINSLSHVFGSRRYKTTDTSRNNWLLAILTLGEGWHNNHHAYMNSVNQGFFWWEIDVSYYVLRAMSWVGITRDLKMAPVERLESQRIRPHLEAVTAPVDVPTVAPVAIIGEEAV